MSEESTRELMELTERIIRPAYREAWDHIKQIWQFYGEVRRRREAMLAARRAHRLDGYRDYRHEPRPPSGCRWCGVAQQDHLQRWSGVVGWHHYAPPADRQILARMRRRREQRRNAPTHSDAAQTD